MRGMHEMPGGSMMKDDEMAEGGMPQASLQAGALESIVMPDASIKAMEKKLAASGAAAAQPSSGASFDDLLASGGEDYSMVEKDSREEF